MWRQVFCWQMVTSPQFHQTVILSHLFWIGKSSPTYYYYYTHPGRLSLGDLLRFKLWHLMIDQIGALDSCWFYTYVFTASHSGSWHWSFWRPKWTWTSSTTPSMCPPTSTRSFSSSKATAYLSCRCQTCNREKKFTVNYRDIPMRTSSSPLYSWSGGLTLPSMEIQMEFLGMINGHLWLPARTPSTWRFHQMAAGWKNLPVFSQSWGIFLKKFGQLFHHECIFQGEESFCKISNYSIKSRAINIKVIITS